MGKREHRLARIRGLQRRQGETEKEHLDRLAGPKAVKPKAKVKSSGR